MMHYFLWASVIRYALLAETALLLCYRLTVFITLSQICLYRFAAEILLYCGNMSLWSLFVLIRSVTLCTTSMVTE